jgi:glucosamine 6-phosphate synthetase-like amidotransferase/phosphosugar isomerase protein
MKYHQTDNFRTQADYEGIQQAFTEMLVRCESRGRSATGLILSRHDFSKGKPRVHILKAPLRAKEFVQMQEYKNLIKLIDRDAFFIIGHTRAVTQGSAHDNKNNHPHRTGGILGVHNGAIRNDRDFWDTLKDKGIKPAGNCDSEAIFAMVERHRREGKDMDEAVASTMREMKGWYALAMMDTRNSSKLVAVRDEGTPLEMAWAPSMKLTMLASEREFILKAVSNSKTPGMPLDWISIPSHTVHSLDSKSNKDTFQVSTYQASGKEYQITDADKELLDITNGKMEALEDNIVQGSN